MLRNILAVIAGIFSGGATVAAFQFLNHRLYPPPPGLDLTQPKDIAIMMERIPLGALLGLEGSYLAGSLAAGAVVGLLAGRGFSPVALVVGGMFTAFNVVNLVTIPHPVWIAALTSVTFIPTVWLAARLTADRFAKGRGA